MPCSAASAPSAFGFRFPLSAFALALPVHGPTAENAAFPRRFPIPAIPSVGGYAPCKLQAVEHLRRQGANRTRSCEVEKTAKTPCFQAFFPFGKQKKTQKLNTVSAISVLALPIPRSEASMFHVKHSVTDTARGGVSSRVAEPALSA